MKKITKRLHPTIDSKLAIGLKSAVLFLSIFIGSTNRANAQCNVWRKLTNVNGIAFSNTNADISAKDANTFVYADGTTVRYSTITNDTVCNAFVYGNTSYSAAPIQTSVASDGTTFIRTNTLTANNIYKSTFGGAPSLINTIKVYVTAKSNDEAYATNINNYVAYQYLLANGNFNGWAGSNNPQFNQIEIATDGTMFGRLGNGNIYKWNASTVTWDAHMLANYATIEAANGGVAYVTTSAGEVLRYHPSTGLTSISTSPAMARVSVANDGTMYGISTAGIIYKLFGMVKSKSANLNLCQGSNGRLWVNAPSASNFVWKFNAGTIANSNNDTLFISNYTATQAGTYTCVVSGSGCSADSTSFTITTNSVVNTFEFNGLIASYPMNVNANNAIAATNNGTVGAGCTLTADRNGNSNRAYDFNGTANGTINMGDITAMNGASQLSLSGWFRRTNSSRYDELFSKVTDSSGVFSRVYNASLYAYNTFGNNTPAFSGASLYNNWFHYVLTFNSGVMKLYINGALVANATNAAKQVIESALGSNFILGDIVGGGTAAYPSDNFIGQMDEINIFSRELNPSELVGLMNAPQFTQHPQNTSLCAGNTISLSVLAESPTATFQWQKDGTPIIGATSSSYTKANAQAADAGSYKCMISEGCNRSISKAAVVTVSSNSITITSQPQAQSKCIGQAASFTVIATGGTGYQWKKNGTNINGQTTATLNLSSVALSDTGTYVCEISGGSCGSLSSQSAYLSVSAIPTATISGASSVCAGSSIALTANGGNTYTWSNNGGSNAAATFSPTGTTTYSVTAILGAGCTATASKTITIKQPSTGSFSQIICFGDSVTFNGIKRKQSGSFLDTLTNAAGCDSFLTFNLTVRPQITGAIARTVCFGGSTTFNGATLTQGGTFKDTLTSVTGCDSILTLTFTVRPKITTTINQLLCNGSSITFNGQTITQGGTFLDTLTSVNSCDSFITLNVTLAQATSSNISQTVCGSYVFNNQTLTQGGTFKDTITNAAGCDSFITLNLTINQPSASTINDTICNGASYQFGTQSLTASGTYTRTILNAVNCDSVITLNLFVRPALNPVITASGFNLSATAGFSSYQWQLNAGNINNATQQTYTAIQGGSYTVQVTDANSCSKISATVQVNNVGIKDVQASDIKVTIYPNPTSDYVTIETGGEVLKTVSIYTLEGKFIQRVTATNAEQEIAVSQLATGIYLIEMETTMGHKLVKRLMKD